jgi:hypothetical protein
MLISGGSGISFAVAHLLQVIKDAKEGKPHPRYFSIIWMVKSRRESFVLGPPSSASLIPSPSQLDCANPDRPCAICSFHASPRTAHSRDAPLHPPPVRLITAHICPP